MIIGFLLTETVTFTGVVAVVVATGVVIPWGCWEALTGNRAAYTCEVPEETVAMVDQLW
jgi:hypothetical protein